MSFVQAAVVVIWEVPNDAAAVNIAAPKAFLLRLIVQISGWHFS